MNISKTIKIGYNTFKMHQVESTGWIFVRGTKSTTKSKTYPVAKIVDNQIVELDSQEAVNGATNQELAEAWIAN